MADEYIRRDDFIQYLEKCKKGAAVTNLVWAAIMAIERDVRDMPAADVAPVQKWISVKDSSPEAGGYVVCIAKRNPFSRFMPMVAKIEKNGLVNPITEQYISDVSHWMPIPEPPKEK